MTRAGRKTVRLLPALLALCLALCLALMALAPAGMAGEALATGIAAADGTQPAAHPCNGDGAPAAGDCAAVSHHCTACFVAVLAVTVPASAAADTPSRALPRRLSARALPRPNVPHGPPRFV